MVRWPWGRPAAGAPFRRHDHRARSGQRGRGDDLGRVAQSLVSYEARTATADPDSARRFGRYWRLVRPFVCHIMRATLTTLRRDVERPDRRAPQASEP